MNCQKKILKFLNKFHFNIPKFLPDIISFMKISFLPDFVEPIIASSLHYHLTFHPLYQGRRREPLVASAHGPTYSSSSLMIDDEGRPMGNNVEAYE